MPSITNFATTAALTTFENKIPNVNDQFRKADYDVKISEIENKYVTNSDYNNFTCNTLDAKIKQKKLINENDLNEKISNKRRIKNITNKGRIQSRARY